MLVFGTKHIQYEQQCQIVKIVHGLPCLQIRLEYISTCASSNISSISYLQEMICWTRCRLSSQNIPKLTSAHWASHQATGRTNHCGAPDDEDRDCHPNRTFARKSKCKSRAEHQARLNAMPRCSFAYAKQMQIESRASSSLECYAEMQLCLCKAS